MRQTQRNIPQLEADMTYCLMDSYSSTRVLRGVLLHRIILYSSANVIQQYKRRYLLPAIAYCLLEVFGGGSE